MRMQSQSLNMLQLPLTQLCLRCDLCAAVYHYYPQAQAAAESCMTIKAEHPHCAACRALVWAAKGSPAPGWSNKRSCQGWLLAEGRDQCRCPLAMATVEVYPDIIRISRCTYCERHVLKSRV